MVNQPGGIGGSLGIYEPNQERQANLHSIGSGTAALVERGAAAVLQQDVNRQSFCTGGRGRGMWGDSVCVCVCV